MTQTGELRALWRLGPDRLGGSSIGGLTGTGAGQGVSFSQEDTAQQQMICLSLATTVTSNAYMNCVSREHIKS